MVIAALLLLLIPKFIGIYFLVKNALDTTCRRGEDDWDEGDDNNPQPVAPTPQPQWSANAHEYHLVSHADADIGSR